MNKKVIFSAIAAMLCGNIWAGNITGRVMAEGQALAGVQVSDGTIIVKTDRQGRYSIDSDKSCGVVFITTPSGYTARMTDRLRPEFWQPLYLPRDKEEVHDFVLERQDQSSYTVLFPTDVHLVNDSRRQDIRRFSEIVMPFINTQVEKSSANGPVYTMNLGDLTHDIYWYEYDFDESDALRLLQDLNYPTPVYSVSGNHDNDGAVVGENTDFNAAWRYRDIWGPDRYSVNIGSEHWIFMDNIIYINVPGQGKKAPGINGDRSYSHEFTAGQMEWLAKDLAEVDPSAQVYLCCHCPILRSTKKKGILLPAKQVKALDSLAGRFANGITIISGHTHSWDNCRTEGYDNLRQITLSATSGIMWETPVDWKLTSSDGSDSGILFADFKKNEKPHFRFETYIGGERYYRVYDMNEVGKAYRNSAAAKKQLEMFKGSRLYYGDSKYKNYVYVNFWGWEPGMTVHLYEKGRELNCECRNDEDPVHNFAYDLQIIEHEAQHHSPRGKDSCIHMYEFKTSGAKTPLLLRIKDKDGRTVFEENIRRPIEFNPSGK